MKLFRSFSAPAGARWLAALLLGSACQLASASSEANLVLPNLNDPALAVFLGRVFLDVVGQFNLALLLF